MGGAVDQGRQHEEDLGLCAETVAGRDDGQIDLAVGGGWGAGVHLGWRKVGVDLCAGETAVGGVGEEGAAAGVDVGCGQGGGGALVDAGQHGQGGGQVVCCCGVDDDVAFGRLERDEGCVVYGAVDGADAGLLEFGVGTADEGGYVVVVLQEAVDDFAADVAWSDEEDLLLYRGHDD